MDASPGRMASGRAGMDQGLRMDSGAPAARLPRSLRGLLAAALLVPLLFLGGAAWFDWQRLNEDAYAEVSRLSAIAKEHALKVVETNAMVLDRLDDQVRGMEWPAIRARGAVIQRDMARMDDNIAQLSALHLADPSGLVVLISTAWPTPPIITADRAYFQSLAAGAEGLVFGAPEVTRLSGIVSFPMARRRGDAADAFDGAVVGSILPGYFQAHWHELGAGRDISIGLIRTDGQVLAMHPRPDSDLIPLPDPETVPRGVREAGYLPVIEQLGERGEWLTAFRRVGEHPLVIAVALSRDAVLAAWLRNTATAAAFALCASLALIAVTLLAIRRWRSEQAMLLRLAVTAGELRAEIARREEAEVGLMQAQRLEALGRLTGGIAHDFNNLLTAILGTVQLLERHLGAAADERARRLLGVARDAVNRGARLNASLLAFARRQQLRATVLDANDLVQGFTPLIKGALGEAITLTVDLEAALPRCYADPAQLEAALLNLAINARDAMAEEAGQCRLATRLAMLGPEALDGNPEAKPGAYVAVSLSDNGVGMPPEVRDRAFEPFFTTKDFGRGTGLGLSQVFGFARQLGGHVAIDSAPGAGTTVTLFLPARENPAGAEGDQLGQAGAGQAGAGHGGRVLAKPAVTVLVAEDDERVRTVTAETLRSAGMRVLAAEDGQAAFALLQAGEPVDVLFSDIVMPGGLNGIALAFAARRLRPGLPVLLVSGYAGTIAGGEDHGFEVIAKPYDQEAVLRRLTALAAPRVDAMA
jgi:two-component system NtrC family sensor kinase